MKTTFESVLEEKYNIKEEFVAIGTFVAFPSFSREPSSLVSVGLNSRCLVVARLCLGGDSVDYEVLSWAPVHLLSIRVQNYAHRKLSVDSPFKVNSWVYQLCSSDDQDEVWEEFMLASKIIQEQRNPVPTLDSGDAAIIVPACTFALEPHPVGHLLNNSIAYRPERSVSLPDILPTAATYPSQSVPRRHSVDALFSDVEFDKFVNDNPDNLMEDFNTSNNAHNNTERSIARKRKFSLLLRRLFWFGEKADNK